MKQILVIDDDRLLRHVIRDILQTEGYEVDDAEDGDRGVELARSRLPNLVLCDVYMKQTDGYNVLRRLRADPATAAIPIILMTANSDEAGMRRGMELGADDYLPKPFASEALLASVRARFKKQYDLQRHIEDARSRLLDILEATTDLVAMADPRDDSLRYLNRAGHLMLGIEPTEDISALRMGQFQPEWALERVRTEGLAAAVEFGAWTGETAFVSRSGREIAVSQQLVVHKASDGTVEFLSTIARDITESKKSEERLRRNEQLFRLITENATELIAVVDGKFKRLYNSPSYFNVLGYTPAELQQTGSVVQIHPDDRELVMRTGKETIASGIGKTIEYRMGHKDGHWVTLESHAGVVRNAKGEVENILIVARDISARKEAEKEKQLMEVQLRHAQKMESIGQLAAGIAHEINTPTQYIGDNTRFLQDAFADLNRLLTQYQRLFEATKANSVTPELVADVAEAAERADAEYLCGEIPKSIEQSLEGIERVAKIVRAMKEFSHPGTEEKSLLDLNKAIDSTLVVARNEWKYVADVVTNFDPTLPLVPCLPGEFNQVILNLVINATHAIGDVVGKTGKTKGTITISTKRQDDWAEIRVRDTGTGIPEHVRGRLFEPFFTTKGVGKGTGQGLAISHSVIVDKHGGSVSFETEMGKGTTFIVRLPIAPAKAAKERRPS